MSAIAADGRSPAALELKPLPAEALPPAVRKLVESPAAARAMAARGIAPLRPAELVLAVYQLSFDADADVKAAAQGAPGLLPDKIVLGPLGEALPAPVLHFFAERLLASRIEALEKILYNQATADQTFELLASRLAERELEIIFQNEARLLRCPAIVHALYFNKQARMSSLNRAIELCVRNNVRVDGIPSFDEVAKSIQEDKAATDPAVVDKAFGSVLDAAEQVQETGGEEAAESLAEQQKKGVIDFSKLKLYEKIRLATLGNAYCRQNLMRDPNRMVAMAAIRSPLIGDNEVVMAASNRALSEDVIRYIANQKEYVKMYQVRKNLVHNPKCPLPMSLRFLPTLGSEDIKALARSKNIPSALATTARKLVQSRGMAG